MMHTERFLAVDQGNSSFKLSLFADSELVEECRVPAGSAEEIFGVVERLSPSSGAFCSVGRFDPRIVESLRIALGGNLLVLSRSTPLPIGVRYSTPSTLGLDRIALAVGAASLFPGENLAVADAGTALTLDVVDSSPAFIGGRISPGVCLRFASLHDFTAALPLVDSSGYVPLAGDSTDTSIRAGVVGGLADEVVETFRRYAAAFSCSRLLITGGDAHLLFDKISNRIPAVHVRDLMARGLLYIYNYNEKK